MTVGTIIRRHLDPGITWEGVQLEQLRVGLHVVLPFRLRTGRWWTVEPVKGITIGVFNRAAALPEAPPIDKMKIIQSPLSEALVLLAPDAEDGNVLAFARDGSNREWPTFSRSHWKACDALNRLVLAYSEATGIIDAGKPLKKLSPSDFFFGQRQLVLIACEAESPPVESAALRWFAPLSIPNGYAGQMRGSLEDLPAEALERIQAALPKMEQDLFRELAFEARSLRARDELVEGLLLAMAAL